jgi:hypothetical protein
MSLATRERLLKFYEETGQKERAAEMRARLPAPTPKKAPSKTVSNK